MQGHIAYPQLAKNPIHALAPALAELAATRVGRRQRLLPADELADQQHPRRHRREQRHPRRARGRLQLPLLHRVDARRAEAARATRCCARHGLELRDRWTLGGEPFLTPPRRAERGARRDAIAPRPASRTELSTTGGTSDGRFIARICPQVIEFGPVNASIHKIDEHVEVADIEPLKNIYRATRSSSSIADPTSA